MLAPTSARTNPVGVTKKVPNPGHLRPQLTERLAKRLVGSRTGQVVESFSRRPVPNHWSFMFGRVAFYCFVVLLLSGMFLTFFYDPSTTMVKYDGSFVPLQAIEMSRALDSTLDISFDVRGGLLLRQTHHWAALMFPAAIGLHLLSTFFTGAFRKPRQLNWVIAFLVFVMALAAGWSGYAMPDDMLSGSGLRIVHGVLLGIPVIGTWLAFLVFGGEFPGNVISHLYPLHVLILPLAILALFGLHIVLAVVHKPPQFAGPGRRNDNVVGIPLRVYAMRAVGLFFMVVGLITAIAATVTINPIWHYGPASPSDASAGSQPDWYMGFVDGALRLTPPGWEIVLMDRTWTLAVLVPVAVAVIFLGLVAGYPFLEAWITGDRSEHHLLERPRNNPVRTGIGAAGLIFYGSLWGAASSDLVATHFHVSIEGVTHFYQGTVTMGPVLGFFLTRQICLALQAKDLEKVLHGFETGRIVRLPHGEYLEVHQKLDEYDRWRLLSFDEHVPLTPRPDAQGRITRIQQLRVRLSRSIVQDQIRPVRHQEPESPELKQPFGIERTD